MQQKVAWYLEKKIAPKEFMVNAANPMLIRSMKAITKRTKTNGMIRVRNLRIVVASIALGATAGLVVMLTSLN